MKPHTTPALTALFYVLGFLTLMYGVIIAVEAKPASAKSFAIFWSVLAAAFQFGCGRALDYLGHSAHCSQQMVELMIRQQLEARIRQPQDNA